MDSLNEKTLKTTSIYKGRIINVQVDDVELPDKTTSKRELVKHPGAVAVIALTPEGKLLMVRQFRKALEKCIYEIPAGKLEPGEEPEVTAMRELEEETGYRTHSLKKLVSFYTSPGFADELVHIYFADELIKGKAQLDADEFLDVYEIDLETALTHIENQNIHDAKTVYAIQYLQLQQMR